eukprot:440880_1
MAVQPENTRKCFENVTFSKAEDKFTVLVQYDANTESLTMTLTNQTTKHVFRQRFSKEDIQQITTRYHLEPSLLVKMITDTFASNEQVLKNARIFITANNEQAIAKRDAIQAMKVAPDAVHMPTGFTPDTIGRANEEETKTEDDHKLFLLFVLHFSAPPYIYLNYCFTLKQKHVSDCDILNMRFSDLQEENKTLQDKLESVQNTIQTQQQQISELVQTVQNQQKQMTVLTQRIQQCEDNKGDDVIGMKVDEIDLNLINNWKAKNNGYAAPKATKIGKIVYLKGSITGGNNKIVATLPQGWRPSKHRRFFLNTSDSWAVWSDGRVDRVNGYAECSLDGISFTLD